MSTYLLSLRAEERAALDDAAAERQQDPGDVIRGLLMDTPPRQLAELLRAYDRTAHSTGVVEVQVEWPDDDGRAIARRLRDLAEATGVRTDRSINRVARAVLWAVWRQLLAPAGQQSRVSEPRDCPVMVRMTRSERELVKQRAEAAGLTVSEFIRRAALGEGS